MNETLLLPANKMNQILIVDDDEILLDGFNAILKKNFRLTTANNVDDALHALTTSGPYAIIVSDLKMPGSNGIEFLEKSRQISPYSIRILFTGYADTETTIQAINQCEIFRLRTKPCPADLLRKTLFEGLKKYWERYNVDFNNTLTSRDVKIHMKNKVKMDLDNNAFTSIRARFTPKEIRIIELLRMNICSKEIGDILNISRRTVECHRQNIRKKLKLNNTKINLQSMLLLQEINK